MSLHIIVCIKAVVVRAPRGRIVRTSDNVQLNPFDTPAIESALQLRSQCGGSLTVLSMGPPSSRIVMTEALAMGADRAVLVSDPCLGGADTLATSTTLAAALQKLAPFELVLFGFRSSDSDTGQVGPQTAVAAGIPLVTGVQRIEPRPGGLSVERTLDDRVETFEVDFPAALTIRPEAARPRDIALGGLAQAFDQREVELLTCADLGLTPERVGEAGSPTRVLSMQPITYERRCRLLEGDYAQIAEQLMDHLTARGLVD
ncbi:MAG: electron transfer flavoprotein subunit beta/FixA family protein [Desulfobacterales bacterium]